MKIGYQTNTWGGVVGHPAGVTSVKDLYYLANGSMVERPDQLDRLMPLTDIPLCPDTAHIEAGGGDLPLGRIRSTR